MYSFTNRLPCTFSVEMSIIIINSFCFPSFRYMFSPLPQAYYCSDRNWIRPTHFGKLSSYCFHPDPFPRKFLLFYLQLCNIFSLHRYRKHSRIKSVLQVLPLSLVRGKYSSVYPGILPRRSIFHQSII